MSDEVRLVLPAQEDFRPIVHLVVGGLAARLDLTFDTLEDVQLALGALLARLDPAFLDRLWFPLGAQSKDETRAEAERAGLAVAHRAESQEACFLAGDDYRSFLGRHGVDSPAGPIVDTDGLRVGTHAGSWRFTPGQRRGIGVSAASPLYVIDTNAISNTVVVGPRE